MTMLHFHRQVSFNYQLPQQNHILSAPSGIVPSHFCLWLDDGRRIKAKTVVAALGQPKTSIPGWVKEIKGPYPSGRLRHALDPIKLTTLGSLSGERVIIVGGGLSSAHLAISAVNHHCSQVSN